MGNTPLKLPVSPGSAATTQTFTYVTITDVDMDNLIAHTTDQLGKSRAISITRSMGKQVAYPQPGENWIITSQYGDWILAVNVNNPLLDTTTQEYVDSQDAATLTSAKAYTDSLGAALGNASWTAYTPSLTNATLGNGTLVGRYIQQGKTINGMGYFILGSTSSVSNAVFFNFPSVAPRSSYPAYTAVGSHSSVKSGASSFKLGTVLASGGSGRLIYDDATNQSATVPWTWGTGDQMSWSFSYETT